MTVRVWADDLRTPPDESWVWFKTSSDAIEWMEKRFAEGNDIGQVMSLDHDLGEQDTTRVIVLWMCENGVWPDEVRVHSANPVGREWLEGMVARYKGAL